MPGCYYNFPVLKIERAAPADEVRVRQHNTLSKTTSIFAGNAYLDGFDLHGNRLDLQPRTTINYLGPQTERSQRKLKTPNHFLTTKRHQTLATFMLLLAGVGLLPSTFRDT